MKLFWRCVFLVGMLIAIAFDILHHRIEVAVWESFFTLSQVCYFFAFDKVRMLTDKYATYVSECNIFVKEMKENVQFMQELINKLPNKYETQEVKEE